MSYLEITFKHDTRSVENAEILIAMLSERGYEGFFEEFNTLKAYVVQNQYNEQSLHDLLRDYPALYSGISFTTVLLPDTNWNAEWESSYSPVNIRNNKVYIRAPFHPPQDLAEYDLVIQPQMSFGTGHHATTRLMTEAVLDADIPGKTVLDMGCGTGILAILCCKRGAKQVMAIDIEEGAYQNAMENVVRNNVENCVIVRKGDASLLKKERFDIIFANINRIILIKDMPRYASALNTDGLLIMSGFIMQDEKLIKQAVEKNNLTIKETVYDDDWVRLSCVKK